VEADFSAALDQLTDLGGAIFRAPTSLMPYSRAPNLLQLKLRGACLLWRRSQATKPGAGGPAGLRPACIASSSGCKL